MNESRVTNVNNSLKLYKHRHIDHKGQKYSTIINFCLRKNRYLGYTDKSDFQY